MEKKTQINLWYLLAAVFAVLVIQDFFQAARQTETIPYSEFKRLVAEGKVAEAVVGPTTITGRFKEPQEGRPFFVTQRVDESLAEDLAKGGVTFTGAVHSTFLTTLLSWIVPALVFFGLWFFLIRRFADKAGFGGMIGVVESDGDELAGPGDGRTEPDALRYPGQAVGIEGADAGRGLLLDTAGFFAGVLY